MGGAGRRKSPEYQAEFEAKGDRYAALRRKNKHYYDWNIKWFKDQRDNKRTRERFWATADAEDAARAAQEVEDAAEEARKKAAHELNVFRAEHEGMTPEQWAAKQAADAAAEEAKKKAEEDKRAAKAQAEIAAHQNHPAAEPTPKDTVILPDVSEVITDYFDDSRHRRLAEIPPGFIVNPRVAPGQRWDWEESFQNYLHFWNDVMGLGIGTIFPVKNIDGKLIFFAKRQRQISLAKLRDRGKNKPENKTRYWLHFVGKTKKKIPWAGKCA